MMLQLNPRLVSGPLPQDRPVCDASSVYKRSQPSIVPESSRSSPRNGQQHRHKSPLRKSSSPMTNMSLECPSPTATSISSTTSSTPLSFTSPFRMTSPSFSQSRTKVSLFEDSQVDSSSYFFTPVPEENDIPSQDHQYNRTSRTMKPNNHGYHHPMNGKMSPQYFTPSAVYDTPTPSHNSPYHNMISPQSAPAGSQCYYNSHHCNFPEPSFTNGYNHHLSPMERSPMPPASSLFLCRPVPSPKTLAQPQQQEQGYEKMTRRNLMNTYGEWQPARYHFHRPHRSPIRNKDDSLQLKILGGPPGMPSSDETKISKTSPKKSTTSTPARRHHHLKGGEPSPSSRNNSGGKSSSGSSAFSFPQNLDNDKLRRPKVKTELCLFHKKKAGSCPYGDGCNYAHGEHELKFKKLLDMERAGLVDKTTYRTHVCFSWLTTGACPFGQRCTSLHDPRVGSPSHYSWLPHADAPINLLPTSVNIDRFYHARTLKLHQRHPLLAPYHWFKDTRRLKLRGGGIDDDDDSLMVSSWEKTYDIVCHVSDTMNETNRKVLPLNHLEIANILRSKRRHLNYVYRPQHVVYDELCMVLQTRKFRILHCSRNPSVREVTNTKRRPHQTNDEKNNANIITVREIAFGPLCENKGSHRPVSLWYDIPESRILSLSPGEVKRWKRATMKSKTMAITTTSPQQQPSLPDRHSFDRPHQPPFYHSHPIDETCFDLATRMIEHRIDVLRCNEGGIVAGRDDGSPQFLTQQLQERYGDMKMDFGNIQRSMKSWFWPTNGGKETRVVDESTAVPMVDECYRLSRDDDDEENNNLRLWKSFTNGLKQAEHEGSETNNNTTSTQRANDVSILLSSLPAATHCSDKRLPHVNDTNNVKNYDDSSSIVNFLFGETNGREWEIVRDFYNTNNDNNDVSGRDGNNNGCSRADDNNNTTSSVSPLKDKNIPLSVVNGIEKIKIDNDDCAAGGSSVAMTTAFMPFRQFRR